MHSKRETFITYLPVSDTVMHCLITWIVWHCCSVLAHSLSALPERLLPALDAATAAVTVFCLRVFFQFAPFFSPPTFFSLSSQVCYFSIGFSRNATYFFVRAHFLRLLSRSVYLFIPHTHTYLYLFRPFFPAKKDSKVVFLHLSHTTFFVVVFFVALLLHQT